MDKRNYMYEFIEKTSKELNTQVRNKETDAKILDSFKDVYKTIGGNEIHVENVEEPIILDTYEKIEVLEKIYNNIDESVKDTFLVGIVQFFDQHNEYYNGKIVEYFRKLLEKRTKDNESVVETKGNETEEETKDNGLSGEEPIDLTGSDLDDFGGETSEGDDDSEDDSEDEEKEEDETKTTVNEVSFEDGPAITAYKKELEELEKELEEKKQELNDSRIELGGMQPELLNSLNQKQKIETLTKEVEELTNKYNEAVKRGQLGMFKQGENAADFKQLLDQKQKELEESKNIPNKLDEIKQMISESNMTEEEKQKYNEDLDKYVNNINTKEQIKQEIAKLEAEQKDLEEKYNEAVKRGQLGMFKQGENAADYKQLLDQNKQQIDILNDELAKLDEEMKSTEESFTKLNQNNDLENNIQNHKDNIKLYYEILEDIKNLYNAIKDGLDLNSEEAKNMINSINERKSKLPKSLNNELTNKLNEVLNLNKENAKKPIPIDKIEDKPKVTWKTFAMLAAGLGLGATIGFLAPTGVVMVTGVALGLLKGYVGKLRGKAEQERLSGKKTIEKIEEPSNKLEANIQKFKQYIKSEEGLRDISWGLTGGLIGLAGGKIAKGFVNQPQTHTQTPNVQNEPNVVEPNNTSSYSDIKIGNKVNDFNVTQGHDSASWAVNNHNTEHLIGKYVDANSTFQKLGIVGPDGAVKTITTPGTSVQDLINAGVSKDNIAVLVGKNGVGQAWETVSELTGEVIENVTRSL